MIKRKDLARKVVKLMARKVPKKKEDILNLDAFLEALNQAYRRDKLVRNFFLSPQVPKEEKLKLLEKLGKEYGISKEVLEVLSYLVEINAFSLIPEVRRLYEHELEKLMNMLKGTLVVPRKLDKRTLEKIRKTINRLLNREIEIEVVEDPGIIGGFVFKTQAFVLDTSVRTQLERIGRLGGA
ncbi:MAG: ATP synthase F1 subunit delta [Aquificae bacterium]|nr:ATP synthase F1 subunit delta [Aquificota bacterium]